jgi:hypothetical protein
MDAVGLCWDGAGVVYVPADVLGLLVVLEVRWRFGDEKVTLRSASVGGIALGIGGVVGRGGGATAGLTGGGVAPCTTRDGAMTLLRSGRGRDNAGGGGRLWASPGGVVLAEGLRG